MAEPADERLQFPAEPLASPLDLADYGGNKSAPGVCFFCSSGRRGLMCFGKEN